MSPVPSVHLLHRLQPLFVAGLIALMLSGCGGANPSAPTLPPDTTHVVVTSVMLTTDPNADLPKPDGTLQTALQRLQQAHGFHFVYNVNTTKLVGDSSGLTKNYHYKLTTVDGNNTATSKIGEWLVINDPDMEQQFFYVKQGDSWVQQPMSAADQTYSYIPLTIFGNAMSATANPQNFTRASADTIDGQLCDHYININATPNNTHEIWVSQATGDVAQIVETTQISTSSSNLNRVSVVFSNVNQPIDIQAPH